MIIVNTYKYKSNSKALVRVYIIFLIESEYASFSQTF